MASEIAALAQNLAAAASEVALIRNPMPVKVFVLGASVSEISGHRIGTQHNLGLARDLLAPLLAAMPHQISVAVQGCEHINRALVVERAVQETYGWTLVDVWPVPEAGGSFAAAAMELYEDPVVVAKIQAEAGVDIGQTMIGMHLRPVAVPIRTRVSHVGHATVTAARSRPPLIGGARAKYLHVTH